MQLIILLCLCLFLVTTCSAQQTKEGFLPWLVKMRTREKLLFELKQHWQPQTPEHSPVVKGGPKCIETFNGLNRICQAMTIDPKDDLSNKLYLKWKCFIDLWKIAGGCNQQLMLLMSQRVKDMNESDMQLAYYNLEVAKVNYQLGLVYANMEGAFFDEITQSIFKTIIDISFIGKELKINTPLFSTYQFSQRYYMIAQWMNKDATPMDEKGKVILILRNLSSLNKTNIEYICDFLHITLLYVPTFFKKHWDDLIGKKPITDARLWWLQAYWYIENGEYIRAYENIAFLTERYGRYDDVDLLIQALDPELQDLLPNTPCRQGLLWDKYLLNLTDHLQYPDSFLKSLTNASHMIASEGKKESVDATAKKDAVVKKAEQTNSSSYPMTLIVSLLVLLVLYILWAAACYTAMKKRARSNRAFASYLNKDPFCWVPIFYRCLPKYFWKVLAQWLYPKSSQSTEENEFAVQQPTTTKLRNDKTLNQALQAHKDSSSTPNHVRGPQTTAIQRRKPQKRKNSRPPPERDNTKSHLEQPSSLVQNTINTNPEDTSSDSENETEDNTAKQEPNQNSDADSKHEDDDHEDTTIGSENTTEDNMEKSGSNQNDDTESEKEANHSSQHQEEIDFTNSSDGQNTLPKEADDKEQDLDIERKLPEDIEAKSQKDDFEIVIKRHNRIKDKKKSTPIAAPSSSNSNQNVRQSSFNAKPVTRKAFSNANNSHNNHNNRNHTKDGENENELAQPQTLVQPPSTKVADNSQGSSSGQNTSSNHDPESQPSSITLSVAHTTSENSNNSNDNNNNSSSSGIKPSSNHDTASQRSNSEDPSSSNNDLTSMTSSGVNTTSSFNPTTPNFFHPGIGRFQANFFYAVVNQIFGSRGGGLIAVNLKVPAWFCVYWPEMIRISEAVSLEKEVDIIRTYALYFYLIFFYAHCSDNNAMTTLNFLIDWQSCNHMRSVLIRRFLWVTIEELIDHQTRIANILNPFLLDSPQADERYMLNNSVCDALPIQLSVEYKPTPDRTSIMISQEIDKRLTLLADCWDRYQKLRQDQYNEINMLLAASKGIILVLGLCCDQLRDRNESLSSKAKQKFLKTCQHEKNVIVNRRQTDLQLSYGILSFLYQAQTVLNSSAQ